MTDEEWLERFPNLRPMGKPPSMYTLNGIGTALVGQRDHDAETGSYIKSYCLCVLFAPVFFFRAYRVANAESGGWYFLGREPLSQLAKTWNYFVLTLIVMGISIGGWTWYKTTPNYAAKQKLDAADELAESGDAVGAARMYRDVAVGDNDYRDTADQKLIDLIDHLTTAGQMNSAAEVIALALDVKKRHVWVLGRELENYAMDLVDSYADKDDAAALTLLKPLLDFRPDAEHLLKRQRAILERLVTAHPNESEFAAQLAVFYEADKDWQRCEKLLAPHEKRLGSTEGARILGRLYAQQGKIDASYALLEPYARERLAAYHQASEQYDARAQSVYQAMIDDFNNGNGSQEFYQQYQRADKPEQQRLIEREFTARLAADLDVADARTKLESLAAVVPVALDLGVVMVHRAQSLADGEARRKELERAEKTFLAIRGVAGESDAYRLNLGRVYYWLGKPAEGKKLFDELLANHQRRAEVLLAVGTTLREVGAVSEARALAEEAYRTAAEQAQRYAAAGIRAQMQIDLDDEVEWLGRSDPNESATQASLSAARGGQAYVQGRDAAAIEHYRDAIARYRKMPDSAARFNNQALVHFALYGATGDQTEFAEGSSLLDKAIAASPADRILMTNASHVLWQAACTAVAGNQIDLRLLNQPGNDDLLSYLYDDAAGQERIAQMLKKHEAVGKAAAYWNRVQVMAPKDPQSYVQAVWLAGIARDKSALTTLARRIELAEIDHETAFGQMRRYLLGELDAKFREQTEAAIARHRKTLDAVVKAGKKDVTFAVAAGQLVQQQLTGARLGLAVDANETVRLAEEAHRAAPSVATRSFAIEARCDRAVRQLVAERPEMAELLKRYHRSYNSFDLLAIALAHGPALRDASLANADVRRTIELILESEKLFPGRRTADSWAVLRFSNPPQAATWVETIRRDEIGQLNRAVALALNPASATTALSAAWEQIALGKPDEAQKILRRCADLGVPVPDVDSLKN